MQSKTPNVMQELGQLWDARVPFGMFLCYLASFPGRLNWRKRPGDEDITAGGDYTTDWFTMHQKKWAMLFAKHRFKKDQPHRILEIGSFEGRSTVFFMKHFPEATITCVDMWMHDEQGRPGVENRFNANTAEFGDRVTKQKMTSTEYLMRVRAEDELPEFDIIYIDGSHARDIVLMDLTMAYPMLRRGGMLIADDTFWRMKGDTGPCSAITAFHRLVRHEMRAVFVGRQTFSIVTRRR